MSEETRERITYRDTTYSPKTESSKLANDSRVSSTSVSSEETTHTREMSAQTVLTLPREMPAELRDLLAPYYAHTEHRDMSRENESAVCRKLFDEEREKESPVKPSGRCERRCWPQQSFRDQRHEAVLRRADARTLQTC